MPEVPLFNAAGDRSGEAQLADAVWGQPERIDLVHQAVEREMWNRRQGTSQVKNRSAVRGGGRKPFRQKGTGRARQGSIRAPHHRHGGVAHGPEPKEHRKDMPQKMRRAAFRSALSAKAAEGSVRVLEGLDLDQVIRDLQEEYLKKSPDKPRKENGISARFFAEWLTKLEVGRKVVLVLASRNENVALSARNLPNVRVVVLPGLSTYGVMKADTLILTQDAVTRIEELYTG